MLAPIVVFVYNRLEHAQGAIESLSKCPEATKSNLFIFSDAARSLDGEFKVASVRQYIHSDAVRSLFQTVTIIEAEKNKGLAKSVITGVDLVIRKYGKVIVVEDDNVVAVNFLDYMNGALDFYQAEQKVWSIGGYTLPIAIPDDYHHDVFMMGRGSSYAWATWLDRWERIDWEIKDYSEFRTDRERRKAFNAYGDDAADMLDAQMNKGIDSWAIRYYYNAFKNNALFVLPVISKVKNNGNDGTGVHVSKTDKRFDTVLDSSGEATMYEMLEIDERIQKEYQHIFNVPMLLKIKRKIRKLMKS